MIRIHEDIGYAIRATINGTYAVDYEIYELLGKDDGHFLYNHKGSPCYNPDEPFKEADVYCHGFVKWDGCSNWHWDEQDDCMLHGCSKQDLLNLGIVLARCWDWTTELLKTFDGVTK